MTEQKPGRPLPAIFKGHEIGVPGFGSLTEVRHVVKEWSIVPHDLPDRPLYLYNRETGHLIMITERGKWSQSQELCPLFTTGLFAEVFQLNEQGDAGCALNSPLPDFSKTLVGYNTVTIGPGNYPLPPSAETISPRLASAIAHFDELEGERGITESLLRAEYPIGEQRYNRQMRPFLVILSSDKKSVLTEELEKEDGLQVAIIHPDDLDRDLYSGIDLAYASYSPGIDSYANFIEQFHHERGFNPAFIAIDGPSMNLDDYQKCLNVVSRTQQQSLVFAVIDRDTRPLYTRKFCNGRYIAGSSVEDFRKLMEKLVTDFRLTQLARGDVALRSK